MSTGDAPASAAADQVTATPPIAPAPSPSPPEERIELPPPGTPPAAPARPRVSPEHLRRRLRILEGPLLVLLVAFAFLIASFRSANSDVFLHLAAGRLAAEGTIVPASDPFTYTGGRWVNHSWLADLVAYRLYNLPGGPGLLVGIKAGLVALLAGLLLWTACRPGRLLWLPASCVFLAVLALSPRLLLQSTVLSFVLLGLTLLLLTRATARSRTVWLLPVVCLLWVNIDGWFLLGPATIALFLLGELLQTLLGGQPAATPDGPVPPAKLALVLLLGLLACLVNPYHVHAFRLPQPLDFSAASAVLAGDSNFRVLFLSPLEGTYFERRIGLSAAGLSFFVLLAVGLLSFVLTAPRWRWWRVLLWLPLAALALWNVRLIPFFAIVSGPIAALNFLDASDHLFGAELRTTRGWRQWSTFGRAFTVLAGLVLVLLAVPGWLQSAPYQNRALGFGIHVDEGLRDAALEVARWREQGALPEGPNWFNTAPEVVNYFAFFCPGEKGFLDHRLPLFPDDAARDFKTVHRALQGEDIVPGKEESGPRRPAWRDIFTARKVRFVVFHTGSLPPSRPSLLRLYSNPDEFTPCYTGGATAILAWRDPEKRQPVGIDPRLPEDYDAEAFGAAAVRAPEPLPPGAEVQPWYSEFLPGEPGSTKARGTAFQHTVRFQALWPYMGMKGQLASRIAVRTVVAVGLIGGGAGLGNPFPGNVLVPLRLNHTYRLADEQSKARPAPMDIFALQLTRGFRLPQDIGPPASLYLAVRRARQAQRERPDDPWASMVLAEAYTYLLSRTREGEFTRELELPHKFFPQLELIRQCQAAAALNRVLELEPGPDLAQVAYGHLMSVFRRTIYAELHAQHRREYLRLSKELGAMPGVPADEFKKELATLEKKLAELDKQLKIRRDRYDANARRMKSPLQKAQVALSLGLVETAVKVLRGAEARELVDPRSGITVGGQLLLDLFLATGRLKEARAVLMPEMEAGKKLDKRVFGAHQSFGVPAFEWFEAQLAAASGDYATADRALADCLAQVQKEQNSWTVLQRLDVVAGGRTRLNLERNDTKEGLRAFSGLLLGHLLLEGASQATIPTWPLMQTSTRKLLPPHLPRLPGWRASMGQGQNYVARALRQQADLWALRAWLSLEAGDVPLAREQATEALNLGPNVASCQETPRNPGHWLALRVLELTSGARGEKVRHRD